MSTEHEVWSTANPANSTAEALNRDGDPFTLRAIAFAVLSSLAWIAAQSFVGPLSGFYVTGEGALAMAFLAGVLFRGRLRPAEYALIFGMVEASSIAAIELGALSAAPLAINLFSGMSPLLQVAPSFFKLPDSYITPLVRGGSSIPSGLAPMIGAMFLINSAFFLLILAATALFRGTMIEVEKLPFPVARACHTVTGIFAPTPTLEHQLKRRAFLEGVVIGVILVLVTEGYLVGQELPFIGLIPSSLNEPLYQALKPLLPGAIMGFSWAGAVWTMWFLYLAPVESTLTAAVANFLAYMVLAPILVAFKITAWSPGLSYDGFLYELIGGGPLSYSWLSAGLLLSAAIFPLLAYILRMRSESISWASLRSNRMLQSLAGLFALTLMGAYLLGAPPLISALLVVAVLLGYNLWLTRSLAELNTTQSDPGLFIGCVWALGSSFMGFRLGEMSGAAYGAIATTYLFSGNATVGAGCMESFRLASLNDMRWKDMALVLACGLLIASLASPLLYLSVLYATGLPASSADPRGILWTRATSSLGSEASLAYLISGENPYPINWPSGLAGFVLGSFILLLRGHFPSLPVSVVAIGIGVATEPGSGFLVFLIPGLARLLTLKIGGIRLYEDFGVPLFTGLSCGAVVGALISSLNVLRHVLLMV